MNKDPYRHKRKRSVLEIMHEGTGVFDPRAVRKGRCPGKTTKIGFYRFMYDLFRAMEVHPDKVLSNTGIEKIIRNEFAAYPKIVEAMTGSSKPGQQNVNYLRAQYNRGELCSTPYDEPVPKRISLRYGIPRTGEGASIAREILLEGKTPALVPVNLRSGDRGLTREEIREECLRYNIRDDRYFSGKERQDSAWKKLRLKLAVKEKARDDQELALQGRKRRYQSWYHRLLVSPPVAS